MTTLTNYALDGGIATITMDDGKVNALSVAMLGELMEQLERAESDEAVIVLTGRERTLSAGFDLRAEDWQAMLVAGARLAERLLAFPHPVVAACNGNAVAMAGFVLLCCDHRIGADGDFRIGLNEVAIGLTVPWFGIEVGRHRLSRPYFDRCMVTGALLSPGEARDAGFLDQVVAHDEVQATALAAAGVLAKVDRRAHAATKLRIREHALVGVRDGIERIAGAVEDW
jgi:enoyl-CoA hydratase